MLPPNTHLVIGIPFIGRPIAPEWAISLATQNYPLACNLTYITLKGMEVGEARNHIAEEAIAKHAKYLWFIDDDVAVPTLAIRKLIYELEQNPEAMVIGGIYCSKTEPPEPVVFQGKGQGAFWQWKLGDVFECDGIGTGCMLIKTELFAKLEKPWFKTIDEACTDPAQFKNQQTDDLYFCDKVIDAGYKILAHGGVQCLHWDASTGTPYGLPIGSFPLKDKE
jgi:GT2 family glycosyltransferase